MDHDLVKEYLLGLEDVWLDYPYDKDVAVYNVGLKPEGKMFAVVEEGTSPVRLSLRCDELLSQVLRDKYIEVMPAKKLNDKYWNTLVLSGQLQWADVKGLITHSYDLAAELA